MSDSSWPLQCLCAARINTALTATSVHPITAVLLLVASLDLSRSLDNVFHVNLVCVYSNSEVRFDVRKMDLC